MLWKLWAWYTEAGFESLAGMPTPTRLCRYICAYSQLITFIFFLAYP
jgi:hypothetical protein